MAETFEGLPDRVENSVHEIGDLSRGLDRGLNDGEFVAAQASDKISRPYTLVQVYSHEFQQFIADQVTERIIDAFEFIDVDVVNRKLLTRSNAGQFPFQPLVKQCSVRQVGQRIVMRKMPDLLFGASALGD